MSNHRLLPVLLFAVVATACGAADKPVHVGDNCSSSQVNTRRCGISTTGKAAVVGCLSDGQRFSWYLVEQCQVTCSDATCDKEPSDLPWNQPDGSREPDGQDSLDADDAMREEGFTPDSGLFCDPGTSTCLSDQVRGICREDGSAHDAEVCASHRVCEMGFCSDIICQPGEKQGVCIGPTSFGVCSPLGTKWIPEFCVQGETCYEGNCVDYRCPPGAVVCKGPTAVQECKELPSGSYDWEVTELCTGGLCQNGACLSACEINIKDNSYLGCNYWALDLANYSGGAEELVALVVSSPLDGKDTNVTITDWSQDPPKVLTPAELAVQDMVVPKGGLKVFMLPGGRDIPATSLSRLSFQVETDSPVTVHQFNPLNGENVFTNDASLLLPDNVGGTEHYIMSWPIRSGGFSARGYFTIVATQTGETTVDVWPTHAVPAGNGVSAMTANPAQPYSFKLQQGQVLSLASNESAGSDLTGSRVVSSQKVSVFGGHECANIPAAPSYTNYCDHVEQQLFPLHAWGDSYIADAFMPRNSSQKDTWRIMAGQDNVDVVLSPSLAGPFLGMKKGDSVQFHVSGSFEVVATGPVLIGHYLQGSNYTGHKNDNRCGGWPNQTGIGDPAFTLVVPQHQFLQEYVFLTPDKYADDYVNIVAPMGTQLVLDGAPVTKPLVQVAGPSGMGVLQMAIPDGVHTITGDQPFGLTVYGYDCDVSYAYPGGLRLKNAL